MDTVLTVPQVAEILQISPSKLYLLIKREQFPHVRIGRNVRIIQSDLEEWIEQRRRPAKQLGFKFPDLKYLNLE